MSIKPSDTNCHGYWSSILTLGLVTLFVSSCTFDPLFGQPPPRSESVPCIIAPDNLISWWPGEGSAEDIQGGNAGVLSEEFNFDDGRVGQAFSFKGTTYVTATTIGLPTADSDRTLELWVRLDKVREGEGFIAGYGSFGSLEQTYHLGTAAKNIFFSQWGGSIFGPELKSGTWYHVAVTNSGSSFKLYLNGQVVATGDLTLDTPPESTFYIGGLPDDTTKRFDGLVDEVAIYGRALSPAEIDAIYQVSASGKCKE